MTEFDGNTVDMTIETRSSTNANRTARPLQKYLGASIAQSHAHFFSGCGFMVGLGKLQVHAKFEVASPSCCRNIIREPQNFEELP